MEEVRRQVKRWQEHVHNIAETIRWADGALETLVQTPEGPSDQSLAERDRVTEEIRSTRRKAFALMQQLDPDQAWFWTEEWQAGEREVDRDIAAGLLITGTPEEFDAALHAADVARAQRDRAG
jgi:hypothetical protein